MVSEFWSDATNILKCLQLTQINPNESAHTALKIGSHHPNKWIVEYTNIVI